MNLDLETYNISKSWQAMIFHHFQFDEVTISSLYMVNRIKSFDFFFYL